jgi:2-polyprenyl-3-methyl-5-hydroxy-6-metoxy-1,4-benzoquinol methylase
LDILETKIIHRFNRRARKYDNPLTQFIGEQELRQIRKLIPENSHVLDFGCGTGRTTIDLLKRGCQVTAFDLSSKMLAIACNKAQNLGHQAEFTSAIADLNGQRWAFVSCIGVLDYYPNPTPILDSLRQFVKPGGKVVVTFPNSLSPMAWLYWLASRATIPATPRTPAFIRRQVQEAGFEVIELLYAFPQISPIGHTLVLALSIKDS